MYNHHLEGFMDTNSSAPNISNNCRTQHYLIGYDIDLTRFPTEFCSSHWLRNFKKWKLFFAYGWLLAAFIEAWNCFVQKSTQTFDLFFLWMKGYFQNKWEFLGISHKNFPQDFPKLDPDWLAPHHPIPNAKFPPITANHRPTCHKRSKVSPPPFPQILWEPQINE